jgi:hypothetical protein
MSLSPLLHEVEKEAELLKRSHKTSAAEEAIAAAEVVFRDASAVEQAVAILEQLDHTAMGQRRAGITSSFHMQVR